MYSDVDINESHFCKVSRNDPWDKAELSKKIFAQISKNIDEDIGGKFKYEIGNTDRSVGANISGYIAEKYGEMGLKKIIELKFKDQQVKVLVVGTQMV